MRPRVPVFHPGSRTPALPERQGVALVGPPGGVFHERGPQWLHGVLVVDAEPDPAARERWARSLFVTSIWAEASVPNVSSLLGDHHLLGQPAREQGGRWVLPFQFDLSEHLGVDRRAGLHHVQVCARTLRSPVLALTCRPGAPDDVTRALFGDATTPMGPVDALLLGSALLRQGQPGAALPHFEAALADEALRGDLDRGVLYQAACAAARAAGEAADQALVERALEWLEEDLARRRRVLQERLVVDFYADVAGELPAGRREAFERLRQALVAHFRLARDEDPDLRVLRERAVDDLFHLLPEPVPAPTPDAVAAALAAPAPAPAPAGPAPAPARAIDPGPPAATPAAEPAPAPAPATPPAPAPATPPAPAPATPPAEDPALRRERMSTARRRAAEIRARVRARLDDLEKKIPPPSGAN